MTLDRDALNELSPNAGLATSSYPRVTFKPGWIADQINLARDLADRLGVTGDIEQMAFDNCTESEMIGHLGDRLAVVRRNAEQNGDSPESAVREFVRFARVSLGIPFFGDEEEFDDWKRAVTARRNATTHSSTQ